jgi:hypothetical protein
MLESSATGGEREGEGNKNETELGLCTACWERALEETEVVQPVVLRRIERSICSKTISFGRVVLWKKGTTPKNVLSIGGGRSSPACCAVVLGKRTCSKSKIFLKSGVVV